MAGTYPTAEQGVLSLIQSQQGGISGQSLVTGGLATGGSLVTSAAPGGIGALGLSAGAATGVGAVLAVGAGILGAIFAKHRAAIAAEAKALNTAFPAWRSLVNATVQAFNNGEVDTPTAKAYIDQAKAIYYQGVQGIIKGKPADGFCGDQYLSAPCPPSKIDPCNGPCTVATFWVEPESAVLKKAFDQASSGDTVTLNLKAVPAHAGFNGAASEAVVIQPPAIKAAVASIFGKTGSEAFASFVQELPPVVRDHKFAFMAAGALLLGVVLLRK